MILPPTNGLSGIGPLDRRRNPGAFASSGDIKKIIDNPALNPEAFNAEISSGLAQGHGQTFDVKSPDLLAFRRALNHIDLLLPETILKVSAFGIEHQIATTSQLEKLSNALSKLVIGNRAALEVGVRYLGLEHSRGTVTSELIDAIAREYSVNEIPVSGGDRRTLLKGMVRAGHNSHEMTLELFGMTLSRAGRAISGDPKYAPDLMAELEALHSSSKGIELGSANTLKMAYTRGNGEAWVNYKELPPEVRGILLSAYARVDLAGTPALNSLLQFEARALVKEDPWEALSLRRVIVANNLHSEPSFLKSLSALDAKLHAQLEVLYSTGRTGPLVKWYAEMRKGGMISPEGKARFEKEIFSRLSRSGANSATSDPDVVTLLELLAREQEVDQSFRKSVLDRSDVHLKTPSNFDHALILGFWILVADPTRAEHSRKSLSGWTSYAQDRAELSTISFRAAFLLRACLGINFAVLAPGAREKDILNRDNAGYGWLNEQCDALARRLPNGAKIRSEAFGLVEAKKGQRQLIVSFPHLHLWADPAVSILRSSEEVERMFVQNLRPDVTYVKVARPRSDQEAISILPRFEETVLDFAYQGESVPEGLKPSEEQVGFGGVPDGRTVEYD